MCGRAAQTNNSLYCAETMLSQSFRNNENNVIEECLLPTQSGKSVVAESPLENFHTKFDDNHNLSPGMKSVVFCKESIGDSEESTTDDTSTSNRAIFTRATSKISKRIKTWGIIPRGGTEKSPLEEGPGPHFSNMMYNARSETLYEKNTYRDLAIRGNTCVWAIDGFFEWKQPGKNVLSNSNTKQPYFIHRRDGLPLLIPGLWKSVRTGRKQSTKMSGKLKPIYEDILLDTFTHLTTSACASLQWIHHRQPVFLWHPEFAIEWINNPSEGLVNQMASLASSVTEKDNLLVWHPVTKLMSNVKYRDAYSVEPIQIETVPSIKSFFGIASKSKNRKAKENISGKTLTACSGPKAIGKNVVKHQYKNIFKSSMSQTLSKIEEKNGSEGVKKTQLKKGEYEMKMKVKNTMKKGTITSFFAYK